MAQGMLRTHGSVLEEVNGRDGRASHPVTPTKEAMALGGGLATETFWSPMGEAGDAVSVASSCWSPDSSNARQGEAETDGSLLFSASSSSILVESLFSSPDGGNVRGGAGAADGGSSLDFPLFEVRSGSPPASPNADKEPWTASVSYSVSPSVSPSLREVRREAAALGSSSLPRMSHAQISSLPHATQVAYMTMQRAALAAAEAQLALESLAVQGGSQGALDRLAQVLEAKNAEARKQLAAFEAAYGRTLAPAAPQTYDSAWICAQAPATPEMHSGGHLPLGLKTHEAFRADAELGDEFELVDSDAVSGPGSVVLMQERTTGVEVLVRSFRTSTPHEWHALIRHLSALQRLSHPAVARLVAFYRSGGSRTSWQVAVPAVAHASVSRWMAELAESAHTARAQHEIKLTFLRQLASAVHYVHEAGIAGLNLTTPGAVVVTADGSPVLCDFSASSDPVNSLSNTPTRELAVPSGGGDALLPARARDLAELGDLAVALFAELTGGGPVVRVDGERAVWAARRVAAEAPLLASFLAYLLQPTSQLEAALAEASCSGIRCLWRRSRPASGASRRRTTRRKSDWWRCSRKSARESTTPAGPRSARSSSGGCT